MNNMTTNTSQNILNINVFNKTDTDITRIVEEKYTKEYLMDGQKGVARFVAKYILMDDKGVGSYIVSDIVRGNGKYKISETEIVSDPEMKGLSRRIYKIILKKSVKIIQKVKNPMENKLLLEGFESVSGMNNNNACFRKELTSRLLNPEPVLRLENSSEYILLN